MRGALRGQCVEGACNYTLVKYTALTGSYMHLHVITCICVYFNRRKNPLLFIHTNACILQNKEPLLTCIGNTPLSMSTTNSEFKSRYY